MKDRWQSIETAPSGEVLVWADPGWVYTATKIDGEWLGTEGGQPYFEDDFSCGEYKPGRLYLFPTHWMSKPEGPDQHFTD